MKPYRFSRLYDSWTPISYIFYLDFLCFLLVLCRVYLWIDEVVERLPPTGPAECRRRVATTTKTKFWDCNNNIRHQPRERMLALAFLQNASVTLFKIVFSSFFFVFSSNLSTTFIIVCAFTFIAHNSIQGSFLKNTSSSWILFCVFFWLDSKIPQ